MLHRQGRAQVIMLGRAVHRTSWPWVAVLMVGGLLGGWRLPVTWGQELTGGMKLIMEELRAVKKSQAEALAEVEDLRRQLRALAAGSLTAVSYRLPPKVEFATKPSPSDGAMSGSVSTRNSCSTSGVRDRSCCGSSVWADLCL